MTRCATAVLESPKAVIGVGSGDWLGGIMLENPRSLVTPKISYHSTDSYGYESNLPNLAPAWHQLFALPRLNCILEKAHTSSRTQGLAQTETHRSSCISQ